MRFSHTSLRVAAVAASALSAVVVVAGSASAVPGPNGKVDVLAAVGSDTTYNFMEGFANRFNANTTFNKDRDVLVNIAAFPTTDETIPANGACTTSRTYGPSNLPPAGSSAGRKALYGTDGLPENADNTTTGCLDIARSSGARDSSVDPSTSKFFAYAKDAVSFAYWGASGKNLTQAQLESIYTCQVTKWGQIPGSGKSGTILRYLPQAGSGTRDFFLKTVLGGVTVAPSTTACPLDETIQENDGTQIPVADQARAILPYSVGQWVLQNKTGGSADISAGNKIGLINGVRPVNGDGAQAAPNSSVILDGSFLGSRFLYNVLDTRLPSYAAAIRVVGVDNGSAGLLCNGSQTSFIKNSGFVPLTKDVTGGGVTLQSYCRVS